MNKTQNINHIFSGFWRSTVVVALFLFVFPNVISAQTDTTSSTLGIVRRVYDTIAAPDTIIFSWRYTDNSFLRLYADFDTTLLAIQLPEVYKRQWSGYTYLGNLGSAVQNVSFFERRQIDAHWLVQSFYPYIQMHQKHVYYNTKSPFTRFHFVTSGGGTEYFTFEHTQNVNNKVNLGLQYEIFTAEGFLIFNETRNRNFSFWTDVDYLKYKARASVNFNGLKVNENGGIRSDYLLADTSLRMQEINVKLTGAKNHYKYFSGAIDHQLRVMAFGNDSIKRKGVWISHHLGFDKMQRLYNDESDLYNDPITQNEHHFYDFTYNGSSSSDTISHIDFKNRASISYQSGKRVKTFIGPYIDHHRLKITNLYRDTLFTYNNDTSYRNLAVGAQLTIRKEGGYSIDLQGDYHPFDDFEAENYKISANFVRWQSIGFDTLYLHFQYFQRERKPDYLYRRYYSNHFKWVNNFQDEKEKRLYFNLRLIKSRLNLEFSINQIENYLFFDTDMTINQHLDELVVFGGKISKKFTWWKGFNIDLNILGQYSSVKIIDLPEIVTRGTFYYSRDVYFPNTDGTMKVYMGFSGMFHSKYYAPGYVPATGQFYNQRERLIGNYPVIDVFAGARIKRFLAFVRVEHVNSGIRGTSYYSAFEYPMAPRNLRFGISWNFYN